MSANEIRELSRWLHCHGNDDDTKAICALWSIQVIQPITLTRIHVHYTIHLLFLQKYVCMCLCEIWADLCVQRAWQQMSSQWERERKSLCVYVSVCVSVCQCMCEQQVCEVSQQDPYIPASKQTCCFVEYTEYTQNKPHTYI